MFKIVEVQFDVNGDEDDLRVLVSDALANFAMLREPAEQYVNKHYSWMNESQRAKKVEQVKRRIALAVDASVWEQGRIRCHNEMGGDTK